MNAPTKDKLLALAERLEDFSNRVDIVARSDMSPSGQAVGVCLLVTTRGNLFADSAAALRAIAQGEEQ